MRHEIFAVLMNVSFKDISAITGGLLTIIASSVDTLDLWLKLIAQIGGIILLLMGLVHKAYQIKEVKKNLKKKDEVK